MSRRMRRFFLIIGVLLSISLGAHDGLGADEKKNEGQAGRLTAKEREIVEMMEILEMMEMLEQMDMLADFDILAEAEEENEEKD